jgi:hypothetical protein
MGKLKIRKDRTPAMLRKLAKAEADGRVARRLLAIANALCGMSRAAAAIAGRFWATEVYKLASVASESPGDGNLQS